ncbi:hypothetical protein, partial [Nitrospirillum viridazoti]|uniref:hypothetical protein n=1 Tax=Nitrospirillum viridazoti TaxID=3144925 RepID=UPI0019D6CC92
MQDALESVQIEGDTTINTYVFFIQCAHEMHTAWIARLRQRRQYRPRPYPPSGAADIITALWTMGVVGGRACAMAGVGNDGEMAGGRPG